MTITTLRAVRKAIDAKFGKGTIEMYRSPSGYYYFVSPTWEIPSLYWYNLDGSTAKDVIDHIHGYGTEQR